MTPPTDGGLWWSGSSQQKSEPERTETLFSNIFSAGTTEGERDPTSTEDLPQQGQFGFAGVRGMVGLLRG